jgi:hypothetical protein
VEPYQVLPRGFIAAQASGNEAGIVIQGSFYQITRRENTHLRV